MKENELIELEERSPETPRPALRDVVIIGGRLVQVHGDGTIIQYLDDESQTFINWDDYVFLPESEGSTVQNLVEQKLISRAEWERIFWGPEQREKGKEWFRNMVTFFGKYTKK